jgi:hypothetical protein
MGMGNGNGNKRSTIFCTVYPRGYVLTLIRAAGGVYDFRNFEQV